VRHRGEVERPTPVALVRSCTHDEHVRQFVVSEAREHARRAGRGDHRPRHRDRVVAFGIDASASRRRRDGKATSRRREDEGLLAGGDDALEPACALRWSTAGARSES